MKLHFGRITAGACAFPLFGYILDFTLPDFPGVFCLSFQRQGRLSAPTLILFSFFCFKGIGDGCNVRAGDTLYFFNGFNF